MDTRWLVCGVKWWVSLRVGAAIRFCEDQLELTPDEQPLAHEHGLWNQGAFLLAALKIESPVLLQFGQGSGLRVLGPFDSVKLLGGVIITGPEQRPVAQFDPIARGWRAVGDEHLWREVFIHDAAEPTKCTERRSAVASPAARLIRCGRGQS